MNIISASASDDDNDAPDEFNDALDSQDIPESELEEQDETEMEEGDEHQNDLFWRTSSNRILVESWSWNNHPFKRASGGTFRGQQN